MQADRINPKIRARSTSATRSTLGYIRGADYLEFAAQDPRQGTIFYTLDQKPSDRPSIQRRDFCLSCHVSVRDARSARHAGPQHRHVANRRIRCRNSAMRWSITGRPIRRAVGRLLRAPARHGSMRASGQRAGRSQAIPQASRPTAQNVTSLRDRFDVDAYPSADADIAALMVFDHQMRMTNLLTRAGWDASRRREATMSRRKPMWRPEPRKLGRCDWSTTCCSWTRRRSTATGARHDRLCRALFCAVGPHDRERAARCASWRSTRRLLRYPCSYTIYSDAFAQLPATVRDAVYRAARLPSSAARCRDTRIPAI